MRTKEKKASLEKKAPLEKRKSLNRSLQAMSVIPLLVLGLVITLFSYGTVEAAMHAEIHTELKNITDSVLLAYDLLYPGDYTLVGNEAYVLKKGDQVLNGDYSIIDNIKADTLTEITIFYQETRFLTTICDDDGLRIVGTTVNPKILNDVLRKGEPQFYLNIAIGGERYFGYYAPIINSDGQAVGMVYAGRPRAQVNAAIGRAVLPIILIALCSMVIVSLITSSYAHKLISCLQKIKKFLSGVSAGNLMEQLDTNVLKRGDELSDIGYSALYMQRSIRALVEQDALTGLHNRPSAENRLAQIQEQAEANGTHFVVALGNIDYFKKINNTYGNACGDLVLKQIATALKEALGIKGFVARWGGEEFILVYDKTELDVALKETEGILDKVRDLAITFEEETLQVTMTFGLAESDGTLPLKDLLKTADDNLRKGKRSGKNRIVA